MKTEDSKKLVLEYMKELSEGNTPYLVEHLADDATWTVMGDTSLWPMAGTINKTQKEQMWKDLEVAMPGGVRLDVTGVTAENDRVAVEAKSYAKTGDGKIYANNYHMIFELRDGKIKAVREYLDTLYAKDILG